MKTMIIKYYSMLEIVSICNDSPIYPNQKNISATWFEELLNDLHMQYNIVGITQSATVTSAIVNSLMTIVFDRHWKDYLYSTEGEAILIDADYISAVSKLVNRLNITAPRYIPLLQSFEKYSSDPTAKISTTTTNISRFNDTPQNGGDFSDDNHTSSITQGEQTVESDMSSIMERLAETYKNFHSIIRDWSNEFDVLFLKKGQIL